MTVRKKQIGIALFAVLILCILTAVVYYVKREEQAEKSLILEESTDGAAEVYASTFSSLNNIYNVTKSNFVRTQLDDLIQKNQYTPDAPLLVRNAFGTNESYPSGFRRIGLFWNCKQCRLCGRSYCDFQRNF